MPASLVVEELSVCYGDVRAVDRVSLEVLPGTVHVLLGSNGAGKTSTLNAISGVGPRSGGSITYGEQRIDRLPPHRVSRLGVLQVPEGRRVVAPLTVEENLLLGAYAARQRLRRGMEPGAFADLGKLYELFPNLEERRRVRAGLLSGGEQQMLALGRALMGSPSILLLDEPSMGLSPRLVDEVLTWVAQIAAAGIGVLMVEQNVAGLEIASRGYVLRHGELVLQGSASELIANPAVAQAYIGGAAGSDDEAPAVASSTRREPS